MQIRSSRNILALSAALALTASALAPTAAFAKGPGPGAGACDADCPNDQAQVQRQARARDGSGTRTDTAANAGGGGQVQARAGQDQGRSQARRGDDRGGPARDTDERGAGQGRNGSASVGAGRGWDSDTVRGPQACEDCLFEMGTLTDDDIAGLVFMANEEKLAHDVYMAFAELYDLPTFERIAMSEARHQVAVGTILGRYGIDDPTADLAQGELRDAGLQQLYTDLIAQGSTSLDEALAAAVQIEVADIADLEQRMVGLDETALDVFNMYSHLLTASGYHQAAFESLS